MDLKEGLKDVWTGVVVILHGRSGVGKSTYVDRVIRPVVESGDSHREVYHVSADFFFQENGTYNFDPSKLSEAHALCLRNFVERVSFAYKGHTLRGGLRWSNRAPVVVVDNTNLQAWEWEPYEALARAYNFAVLHILFEIPKDIEARNQRGKNLAPHVEARQTTLHEKLVHDLYAANDFTNDIRRTVINQPREWLILHKDENDNRGADGVKQRTQLAHHLERLVRHSE